VCRTFDVNSCDRDYTAACPEGFTAGTDGCTATSRWVASYLAACECLFSFFFGLAMRGLATLVLTFSNRCRAQREHGGQRIARCGLLSDNLEVGTVFVAVVLFWACHKAAWPCSTCRRDFTTSPWCVALAWVLLPLCFSVHGFLFDSPKGWQRAGEALKCTARTCLQLFRLWRGKTAIYVLGSRKLFWTMPVCDLGPSAVVEEEGDVMQSFVGFRARGMTDFTGFNAEMLSVWSAKCGAFWPCM
jgi:hypothetical protein